MSQYWAHWHLDTKTTTNLHQDDSDGPGLLLVRPTMARSESIQVGDTSSWCTTPAHIAWLPQIGHGMHWQLL